MWRRLGREVQVFLSSHPYPWPQDGLARLACRCPELRWDDRVGTSLELFSWILQAASLIHGTNYLFPLSTAPPQERDSPLPCCQ